MPVENILTLVEARPVQLPPLDKKMATDGYMALSHWRDGMVLLRGIPENNIILSDLEYITPKHPSNGLYLKNAKTILEVKDAPVTDSGAPVLGYEDPTVLDPDHNPVSPNKWGFLCTQVFPRRTISMQESDKGAAANLVYVNLQAELYNPHLVMSPQMATTFGLAPFVDMVKEGEWLPTSSDDHILIEYADGVRSNLGWGRIGESGKVVESKVFLHALDDQSEHLSTGGGAIRLTDGRWLMPINRRRSNEWGVTFMVGEGGTDIEKWNLMPEWLIRADNRLGRGPGNQLIAFGSCLVPIDEYSARFFYHINDNSVWEAIVKTKVPFALGK